MNTFTLPLPRFSSQITFKTSRKKGKYDHHYSSGHSGAVVVIVRFRLFLYEKGRDKVLPGSSKHNSFINSPTRRLI